MKLVKQDNRKCEILFFGTKIKFSGLNLLFIFFSPNDY